MQTTWGSREGADGDHAYRMVRVTAKQEVDFQLTVETYNI